MRIVCVIVLAGLLSCGGGPDVEMIACDTSYVCPGAAATWEPARWTLSDANRADWNECLCDTGQRTASYIYYVRHQKAVCDEYAKADWERLLARDCMP